jgi:hypothetical protein
MREVVHGLIEKRAPQGIVLRVHYRADPDRDPAINPRWREQERKKYSSQGAWDREQEVIHEAGGGERVFAEVFSRWTDKIIVDGSRFQPSPHWRRIGGFDHGKANPTAALVGCVDFDGVVYLTAEYYQPGFSPKQHRPNLVELQGFLEAEVLADPSIFYKTQAQGDGSFKAIADLYAEEGITNLLPAPQNNELLGMERILSHWLDLEGREPTLKIVCPSHLRDIQRPIYGVHNNGCPNLLWELRRARREELSAGQLVHRNPTERIVDKDNHLRDALKYMVLSLPEPTKKTALCRAQEAVVGLDPSSALIWWDDVMWDYKFKEEKRILLGRTGVMRELLRRKRHSYR